MKHAFVSNDLCKIITNLLQSNNTYTLVPLFHPVNNWKYRFNVVMSINLYTLQNLVQN